MVYQTQKGSSQMCKLLGLTFHTAIKTLKTKQFTVKLEIETPLVT